MLGWWALSDAARYSCDGARSTRPSNESAKRASTRLRLRLPSPNRIPYPSFGLVSLLDFEPRDRVPDSLEQTYCILAINLTCLDAPTPPLTSSPTRVALPQ